MNEFNEYVYEVFSAAGDIVIKPMMGGYLVYLNGKLIGDICANELFLKRTPTSDRLLADSELRYPYEGSKTLMHVFDSFDDKSLILELLNGMYKAKELRLMERSGKVFFEDTDCLITRFYMGFLKDSNLEKNERLAEAIAALNSYDLILFLEPDVEWVQDGDRSEVIAADRKKYSEMIKALFTERGFPFKTITGDYNSRFDQAVSYVNELLSG